MGKMVFDLDNEIFNFFEFPVIFSYCLSIFIFLHKVYSHLIFLNQILMIDMFLNVRYLRYTNGDAGAFE